MLFCCGACSRAGRTLPFYDSAEFTPKWNVSVSSAFHEVRPFSLIDQGGSEFTEKDIGGRIAIVDFFFTTCPGICPTMTRSMAALQKEFLHDDDVVLLSHSVMPETDTVSVLSEYAGTHGVRSEKWKLLTGRKSEIYDLGRRYYFVDEDEGKTRDGDAFLHTENFVLIDRRRRIRGIYNGLDPDGIRSLTADVRILQRE